MTESAHDMERELGVPVHEWGKLIMVDVGLSLTSGIETVFPAPRKVFYRVSESAANLLVSDAKLSAEAFDAARQIVVANLLNWEEMPLVLRAFASGVLRGDVKRPRQQGGGVTNRFVRWQIYAGCKSAHDLFGLPLVRQDHEAEDSAADLMANLATEYGHPFAYNTVRDWLKSAKYKTFREKCDASTAYLRAKYLFDLGVIRTLR